MNRRQIFAAAGIGSLLGAALGTSFLASEMKSGNPRVTINRTFGLFAMLIEHDSVRVLLLHGDEGEQITELTESTAGFVRQRLDVVLASDPVLRMIPSTFIDRWKVSAVYAIPDMRRAHTNSMDGRALSINGLRIILNQVPHGAWRQSPGTSSQAWYLLVEYGSVCCVYGSSGEVLDTFGRMDGCDVLMGITNDPDTRFSNGISMDIIGMPESVPELSMDGAQGRHRQTQILRLYRHYPITLELRANSILVPQSE